MQRLLQANFPIMVSQLSMRRALRQMAVAGAIGTTGDVIMQCWEGSRLTNCDGKRSMRLAAYRCIQMPVVDFAWQRFDQWVTVRGAYSVAAKIALDQLLISPPFIVGFFTWMGVTEGLSLHASLERMQVSFFPTVRYSVPFWCTIHIATFSVVPSQYRVAWACSAAVFWNAIMSHLNQKARRHELR
mmetsp:Transcript_108620/g.188648  ORF Transcript_108620/g.188648 Transcript_108620/m.188648 type:complete len:186 (-) Transcript_108620:18-575(-)